MPFFARLHNLRIPHTLLNQTRKLPRQGEKLLERHLGRSCVLDKEQQDFSRRDIPAKNFLLATEGFPHQPLDPVADDSPLEMPLGSAEHDLAPDCFPAPLAARKTGIRKKETAPDPDRSATCRKRPPLGKQKVDKAFLMQPFLLGKSRHGFTFGREPCSARLSFRLSPPRRPPCWPQPCSRSPCF